MDPYSPGAFISMKLKISLTLSSNRSGGKMKLHTILLQNNTLHEIPAVLKDMPSLRVTQLHGNPCENQIVVRNTVNSQIKAAPDYKPLPIISRSRL